MQHVAAAWWEHARSGMKDSHNRVQIPTANHTVI